MAISIVQTVQGGGSGISGTLNITIASTAAGNCLIVVIGNNASNVVPSAVTLGGTGLTDDASKTDAGANAAVSFWSLPNIASGQTAVAITHAATWSPGVTVLEVSGLATASVFDVAPAGGSSSAGSQASFDSGSTTTGTASELWVGCCVTFGTSGHTTITPTGTGTWNAFTNIQQGSFTDVLGASQIASSTGTLRYTGTLSPAAGDWVALAASYKGAGGGPPPGNKLLMASFP